MKKIILILTFIISINSLFAQHKNAEKIKAMKTAFITTALDLTPKEAQNFWPIYNEYDKKIFNVKIIKTRTLMKKIRDAGGVENLSDKEADVILDELIGIDFDIANAKQKLKKQLKGIIPSKKMVKLFRAEHDFNKRLLREFRSKRKKVQENTRN